MKTDPTAPADRPRFTPADVRAATERVAADAEHVRIDGDAVARWAKSVSPAQIRPATYAPELSFSGTPAEMARWTLLLDCMNFCFWSQTEDLWTVDYLGRRWQRYSALLASLHRAVSTDREWLRPHRWACARADQIEVLFAGRGRIPLLADRVRIINETGQVTLSQYDGEPIHLAESTGFDAAGIAALVAQKYDSFHDVHLHRGKAVPILKRAQILAADLASAWKRNGGPAVGNLAGLTAFADYRIPQVLRHLGILVLAPGFESRIEAGDLIAPSSREETELRACSIRAVELMRRALRDRHGADVPAWLLDDHLWERSHDADVKLRHHLTLTWYY